MPATSEFSNRYKVNKLVGYLDISEAVKLWSSSVVFLDVNYSTLTHTT
jgi:hypothetical protein